MELLRTIEEVFAHRLRELRGTLTQAEMAEKLGAALTTYQRWESGRLIPQADKRAELSVKLHKPETWFVLDPDLTAPTPQQAIEVLSVFIEKSKPSP